MPGGGFRATNLSLRFLILSAYRLKGFQLIGGPDWLDSARFDIAARAPENTTQGQTLLMLRTLLEEVSSLLLTARQRSSRFMHSFQHASTEILVRNSNDLL